MKKVPKRVPLSWRLLGVLIIAISLFLGFYLKMHFIQKNHEFRERLDKPPPADMQKEAEELNKAVGTAQ